jgi:periplasmic copper chaperone A
VRIRTMTIAAAVAAALVLAPAAAAHVTLNPGEWEAGGFARFAVRVPNERDAADTTRVTVKFPEQILSANFQPIEGWRRVVKMVQLDEPIDDEGEQITERIDTVTWSGGRIRPGEFQEFGVSFQVPEDSEPGSQLAFPSVQRYSNGEVVRWIGPEDADEPAPTVTVLEPAPEEGAAAAPTPEATPAQPAAGGEQDEEGGSDTLAIIALIVGVIAFWTGLAALLRGRRRGPEPTEPQPEAAVR